MIHVPVSNVIQLMMALSESNS